MAHRVVVVRVVRLGTSFSLVDKLRIFGKLMLNEKDGTSANHPISWLLVCGTFHLSLGVCVTVFNLSLISDVSSVL